LIAVRLGALALAFLVGTAGIANAEDPVSIEIVEHGLYAAYAMPAPGVSRGGIGHTTLSKLCHLATTEQVPARLGIHFGLQFRVYGPPEGAMVSLTKTVRFPGPLKSPKAAVAVTVDGYGLRVRSGATIFTGFVFGSDWQLVRGWWAFEFSQNGRVLAKQYFEVNDVPVDVEMMKAQASACFPISSLFKELPWRAA
jgi:hypothetical protein